MTNVPLSGFGAPVDACRVARMSDKAFGVAIVASLAFAILVGFVVARALDWQPGSDIPPLVWLVMAVTVVAILLLFSVHRSHKLGAVLEEVAAAQLAQGWLFLAVRASVGFTASRGVVTVAQGMLRFTNDQGVDVHVPAPEARLAKPVSTAYVSVILGRRTCNVSAITREGSVGFVGFGLHRRLKTALAAALAANSPDATPPPVREALGWVGTQQQPRRRQGLPVLGAGSGPGGAAARRKPAMTSHCREVGFREAVMPP